MPKVFISYSHNDRYTAEGIAEQLQEHGYQAWIDVDGLIGGDAWERAIEKAIIEADRLLVVFGVRPTRTRGGMRRYRSAR